ncbi:MAG TPA: hypothetical protein VJT09_12590 [Pyrinomonadaceae bacterium]|nr:hypothetical protein [Pyrinomonadaceae bacterium]
MDERSINGAAIRAIHDLEIDCEIKDVCRPSGKEEWCIQFSGKYGQFCDDFKNQFGKENSIQVIREKIKSHLLKQVSKIRSSTGRRRRPAASAAEESTRPGSDLLSAPLELVKEAYNRAAGIAGTVFNQASAVAETAREVVSDAASSINPVTIEVRSETRRVEKKARASSKRKTKKAGGRAAKRAGKQTKKRAAPAKKSARRTRKAASKTARKAR